MQNALLYEHSIMSINVLQGTISVRYYKFTAAL